MPPIPKRRVVPQPAAKPSPSKATSPTGRKPDLSKWKEETIVLPIQFTTTTGYGVVQKYIKDMEVKVKRLGNLAVYPSVLPTDACPVTSDDKWTVGTCTSGRALIKNAVSEEQAMLIAEAAWSRAKVAFSQPTNELVLHRLPKWVKGWLEKCWADGKFVEPPPESD